MDNQNEITEPSKLLDEKGQLIQKGWARHPILEYNREYINARWHRIKEWDYYAILNDKYGITFTLTDLGILGLGNITWLDFENESFTTEEEMKLLTRGKLNLPQSSQEGDVDFNGSHVSLDFIRDDEIRTLRFSGTKFADDKEIKGEIQLYQPDDLESIVIATPWENKPSKFYYNQKINTLRAEGVVSIGNNEFEFNQNTSFGVLDWGRGNWPYSETWYWGSASGTYDDKLFGFNIGYGFGDLSNATENAIFYDGVVHKLDKVEFIFDSDDFLKPWRFTSNDDRFEMTMEPIVDRNSAFNIIILKSIQHQVFGKFSGKVVLDDGTELKIENLIGFAEIVSNRW